MNHTPILRKIDAFYHKVINGEFSSVELAKGLEELANLAWDEVDELYQSAIRIDP